MGTAEHDIGKIEASARGFGSVFHQMSHELRNPLNSITGFAELLLMDGELSATHADYVRAILNGSEELTEKVVSLLDRVERRSAEAAEPPSAACHSPLARAGRWGSQRLLRRGRRLRP